ncbi:MAG: ABC transporter permease [Firmicutes bacterium]|jgi:peptide/nickel transport system permease protein|nr:ABC transporter permease [Bacillota bacterium]
MFWRRFKRDRNAVAGLVIITLIVLMAVFAPVLAPFDINAQDLAHRREAPSKAHPFGTDIFGRDILGRIVYGARTTLLAGVLCVLVGGVVGSALGLVAGYYEGWVSAAIMRAMDVLLAFPYFLLAILIVAVLGPGLVNAVIAVSVTNVPNYARVVRSSAMVVKRHEMIEAARAMGASDARIIFDHVLPNVLAPIIVLSTVGVASAVISTAALGFLGLGAQPPTAEWGLMLSEGRSYITASPHITFFPGLFIVLLVLGFNLLGDGLRDILDPRLK